MRLVLTIVAEDGLTDDERDAALDVLAGIARDLPPVEEVKRRLDGLTEARRGLIVDAIDDLHRKLRRA